MAKYHVYGLGAALVDTEIDVSDNDLQSFHIEKGLMTLVDEARQHELIENLEGHLVHSKRTSGGSACNSVVAASSFGASAYYSCKVANDENGDFYLNDLKNTGVDTDFDGEKVDGITGKCLVMITPDAERTMNTYLGVSETFSAIDLNEAALADSEYVYFEGYLVTSDTGRAAAIKARQLAEQNNVKTSISLSDPGMVQFFKPGLQEMIGDGVDLLFCNKDEALGFADTQNLDEAIAAIKKVAKTFAITLGAEGAVVFDGNELIDIQPYAVKAVDTNGAGDMFAGAFIYGITHGMSFAQAGDLASKAASQVVADYGPRLTVEAHQALLA
ncbi:adenosine kinase [Oceanicoccus sagamiensis]|uniref:Adenosine kinase n=1 Tax=Oceanicoccus sagamiensis TaxID=716816 RepID=A0A1X9NDZ2_9GAMM|nr:adenosine kinase [Oceanicoccus sagamiensis]ARN73167.1 adenosine kinase [Oceanicoccus sagamiensis]